MKKIVVSILIVMLFNGCNSNHTNGLSEVAITSDTPLAATTARISTSVRPNEIARRMLLNLDTIEFSRKTIVNKVTVQPKPSEGMTDSLKSEIARLNQIIERNKKEISSLNSELDRVSETEWLFQDTITLLARRLIETEAALETMKHFFANTDEEFRFVEFQLYTMTGLNFDQKKKIDKLTDSLARVYYIVQSQDYLLHHGIIRKRDGVLSFIQPKEIDPEFRISEFTRSDQRKLAVIPIGDKKTTIITTHPPASYKMTAKNSNMQLLILNPAEFWRASKYLVIAAK